MGQLSICTLTNEGYADYTKNMLFSFNDRINSDLNFVVYCLDERSADLFSDSGENQAAKMLFEEPAVSSFAAYGSPAFKKVTYAKWRCIYNELLESDFVLFTDGDVVFLRDDTLEILSKHMLSNPTTDILIQNDSPKCDDQHHENLCTGFMCIRASQKTIDLFAPQSISQLYKSAELPENANDQDFFNRVLRAHLHVEVLPLADFPNGKYYYRFHDELSPCIVHFNWLIGHEKKDKMKNFNMWFI